MPDRNLNAIAFANATTGYIVGGLRDSIRTIFKTTDGGQNWATIVDEDGGGLNDITFTDSKTGYIAGDSATLLKTVDAGLNWVPQLLPDCDEDQRLNTVVFYNATQGVVGGNNGRVWFYTESALPEVQLVGATMTDSVTAIIYAGVNTHGHPGAYTVFYAADSNFTNTYGGAYPAQALSDTLAVFEYSTYFAPLIPDTTYYYRIRATTLAGAAISERGSFYTRKPDYTFETGWVTDLTATGATLTGRVDKLPGTTNLYFEYGTTQALGTTIAASPAVVSDTLPHEVTLGLQGLQPYVTYYYRLKGNGSNVYMGKLMAFTLGTVVSGIETLPLTNAGSNTATFNGSITGCRLPATLTFEYDTGTNFSRSVVATPAAVNDTQTHTISAEVTGLLPLTQYHYRIKAHTSAGDFVGSTISFALGLFTNLEATPATVTSPVSATLNGRIDNFSLPATFTFEYGTYTGGFDSIVAATPDSINDTLPHNLSATIALTQNPPYFYRLKAHTAIGDFYSGVQTFYPYNGGGGNGRPSIRVYPNPANTTVTVEINYTSAEDYDIRVYDLYGKLRLQGIFPARATSAVMDVKDLNPGVYAVQLRRGNNCFAAKLVVH